MGYLPDLKRCAGLLLTDQAFVCIGLFIFFTGTCCPGWRVLSYISAQLGLCPGPQAGLPSADWLPDTAVPINDQWKEPALPHSLIPLHWRRGHLGGPPPSTILCVQHKEDTFTLLFWRYLFE